jgi:hypothetical protein
MEAPFDLLCARPRCRVRTSTEGARCAGSTVAHDGTTAGFDRPESRPFLEAAHRTEMRKMVPSRGTEPSGVDQTRFGDHGGPSGSDPVQEHRVS